MTTVAKPTTFAARLAALRLERGLSRQQLAEAVGVSAMQLSRLERGLQQPRLPTLRRIAAALGVGLSEFK